MSSDEEGGLQSSDAEDEGVEGSTAAKLAFNDKKMFKDEKSKDSEEHKFNFGDQDLDKFQDKLKTKYDAKLS